MRRKIARSRKVAIECPTIREKKFLASSGVNPRGFPGGGQGSVSTKSKGFSVSSRSRTRNEKNALTMTAFLWIVAAFRALRRQDSMYPRRSVDAMLWHGLFAHKRKERTSPA